MRREKIRLKIIVVITAITLIIGLYLAGNSKFAPEDYISLDKLPAIYPDYSGTIIPPNIAPLNFYIKEEASQYYVRIYSDKGGDLHIYNRKGGIRIPPKPWKILLNENKGNELYFEIFARKENGMWHKYNRIVNKIAEKEIDSFLIFRMVHPQFYSKLKIKLYQRNLENFNKQPILDAHKVEACFNCHSFFKNSAQKFIIQVRRYGKNYMALYDKGKISLIAPKLTRPGSSYLAWHPSGNLVALTVNLHLSIFNLFAGSIPEEVMEHVDMDADLAMYNIDTNTVSTAPDIAQRNRLEIHPEWSPDGKYLYFLSAPKMPIAQFAKIKYDLMRISYDAEKDTWGKLEMVIDSFDTGLGVTFPKFSPDGRYLLFCMVDHASLSIVRSSTDLYLMDIETGNYRKLRINSDRADSYHSWSSNSRWFAFSSKRDDGIFTKVYFSYIDKHGKVYKPFVLPQKDPYFYDTFVQAYNIPELIQASVRGSRSLLLREIPAVDKLIDTRLDPRIISKYEDSSNQDDSSRYKSEPDYLYLR